MLARGKASPYLNAEVELRLQISCQMRAADLPQFYQITGEYIELIQSAGLYLLLSGWRAENETVTFYNYWAIQPDANGLVTAEYKLPDSPIYARFADLFVDEIKDIAVSISKTRLRPPAPVAQRYLYLRAAYRVHVQDLCEFVAQIDGDLPSFAKDNGWLLGDIYLGLTGSSTSLVQMWIIPMEQAGNAAQKLARAPWRTLAFETPVYTVLEPAPNDPVLGTDPQALPAGAPNAVLLNQYLQSGLVL